MVDVERMGKPEKILREHNMLCNPRTPRRVRESVKPVALDALKPADGSQGGALVERLKAEGAKVLSVTSALPDYRALMGGRELEKFERDVSSYGGLWCCNRPPGGRGPGHIWYDFLWDVIPHRDRAPRPRTQHPAGARPFSQLSTRAGAQVTIASGTPSGCRRWAPERAQSRDPPTPRDAPRVADGWRGVGGPYSPRYSRTVPRTVYCIVSGERLMPSCPSGTKVRLYCTSK